MLYFGGKESINGVIWQPKSYKCSCSSGIHPYVYVIKKGKTNILRFECSSLISIEKKVFKFFRCHFQFTAAGENGVSFEQLTFLTVSSLNPFFLACFFSPAIDCNLPDKNELSFCPWIKLKVAVVHILELNEGK